MRFRFGLVALTVTLGLMATIAEAQTTLINPRAIRFTSADHEGDPLRRPTTYAVDFFAPGATSPTQSPTTAASSVTPVPGTSPQQYEVTFAQLAAYPAGTTFTSKVRAVNAAGTSGGSNATGPFGQPVSPAAPGQAGVVP